ncbi:hypothetical protein HYW21_01750, partial [Candidatus Woesearchaeota archaeon]|nr:hypothetical protein [Candidatus Woesearchaeota archaeon]
MKREIWITGMKGIGLFIFIFSLYLVFENPHYFQSLTITGNVVQDNDVQSLVSVLEARLESDPYSTDITVSGLVQNLDGTYEMNFSVSAESGQDSLVQFHGLNDPAGITTLQSGYDPRFATAMVYVGGVFTFTNATVRLPIYNKNVTKILKCPNEQWHTNNLTCSRWESTNLSFIENNDFVEIVEVASFSGYVGTSYTYDDFEASGTTDYCDKLPQNAEWSGSICSTGAGSFTIIQDTSIAYMDKKYGNVSKSNSGNSSKVRVEVYDQYTPPGKTSIYLRSYINVQNVSVASGTNYAWIFMGVADASSPLPYLQAFAYFDENESLGCGYFSGSGQGTFGECANQIKQNLSLNSWHQLELYYSRTGQVICWLNSTVFCNQTGISFNNEQIRYVSLGVVDNSVANATGTILVDEFRAAASVIGAYPSISNITVSNLSVYDDQNVSLFALISDPDAGDSIQTAYLNKSVIELFQLPQVSSESRAGTLTSAGSNYSLMLNESLYAKSPSSASYTVYLSLFGNDSVGQVQ